MCNLSKELLNQKVAPYKNGNVPTDRNTFNSCVKFNASFENVQQNFNKSTKQN